MNTSEATIIDFAGALGEETGRITTDHIRKYSDRKILRLSHAWSREVSRQRRRSRDDDEGSVPCDGGGLEIFDANLSSECAALEVEAMARLAVLENRMQKNQSRSSYHSCEDDGDDDGLSRELSALKESENYLRKQMEGIDMMVSSLVDEVVHKEKNARGVRDQREAPSLQQSLVRSSRGLASYSRYVRGRSF
eukprot:CAMPEP_0183309998 /NCGR_PEP_ID=MMETSP0160_2-20130417/28016_1 /TAXON_ID=2839 ORGANISM="Odontella Sinensis, Strain Grunow 1884" /NCGR_SAMPLE_ID=MMETSP0160_2 /ASSEMBLY_ACC=CAM_ASM_000250 /LENGTH=192 /DNA_ID=CAMNT_0025474125 /DNA_START=134 /DNA_END=712 /DNA_ORIENTATION=+